MLSAPALTCAASNAARGRPASSCSRRVKQWLMLLALKYGPYCSTRPTSCLQSLQELIELLSSTCRACRGAAATRLMLRPLR